MTPSSFLLPGLARARDVMRGHVASGEVCGLVTLVSRHGETHVEVMGTAGPASTTPMRRDTIFRLSSMTKPIAAVAAMILVEECKLRLDDPIDRLLPELADRKVLKSLDGPLDDVVPAKRPISVRDLLTLRLGLGHVLTRAAQSYPIVKKAGELGILHGPPHPQQHPDEAEWLRRLASLPLMHQPGTHWMYDVGLDLLGVVVARAAGKSFGAFLNDRVFGPLGMKDTAFSIRANQRDRFTAACEGKNLYDDVDGEWSKAPTFESAASGLVSTVDDYLAFCRMMLDHGRAGSEQILSRASIELMTRDHLTAQQREGNGLFFGDHSSWGLGTGVVIARTDYANPGRFGWEGGLGTSAWSDPREDLVGILMTQRLMTSPSPPVSLHDFWTTTYASLA